MKELSFQRWAEFHIKSHLKEEMTMEMSLHLSLLVSDATLPVSPLNLCLHLRKTVPHKP